MIRDFQRYFKDKEERPTRPKILTRHQKILQHKDRQLAEACAGKSGLLLGEFEANDELELYFNVYRDISEKSICHLSKGWSDPGYRIGECIKIDKGILDFKEKFYKMLDICSDNLIAIKVFPARGSKVRLDLQIGIYQDGFNEKVLSEALDSLQDSLNRIRQLLGR